MAETISGGAWPSGATVGLFTTAELCAPLPSGGGADGEPEETLEGAELVSTGDERNHESDADADTDADADATGDESTAGGKPGIGVAVLGKCVFPGANTGAVVIPDTGGRSVL
ncbi:MAG: hypothetical protein WCF26_06620 [Candidatus Sulfotelmatobacter sp.]